MKLSLKRTASDIEGSDIHSSDEPPPPPDGGFGWMMVGACSTINCFTWGVTAVNDDSFLQKE
jgi:hypothetical protein